MRDQQRTVFAWAEEADHFTLLNATGTLEFVFCEDRNRLSALWANRLIPMPQAKKLFILTTADFEFAAAVVRTFASADGAGFIRNIEKILIKKALNLLSLVIGQWPLKLHEYIVIQLPREVTRQAFFSHAWHLTEYRPN